MSHTPILFSLFGQDDLLSNLVKLGDYDKGALTLYRFPDGESLVEFQSFVQGRDIIFVDSLDHPDSKLLPLLFAAKTAQALGQSVLALLRRILCTCVKISN